MKKIVNFEKINETCDYIEKRCQLLREKKFEILKCVHELKTINNTDNIIKISLLYNEKIDKLEKIIIILEFYVKMMRNNSNINQELFSEFKNKLKNSLLESEELFYEKY